MDGHDALRQMVRDYPGGVEAVALRLGKPWQTLDKELRAAPGYKLGIREACAIGQLCAEAGAPSAAAYATSVASHCGVHITLAPADGASPMDVMHGATNVMREVADVVGKVTEAGQDDHYSPNEIKRIKKEAREAIAAIQQLVAHVDGVAASAARKAGTK